MSRETPNWAKEQIRKWIDIWSRTDIRTAVDKLSTETLISFFEKNKNTRFSKEGHPDNSAAHIVAYQKALNLLNWNSALLTDGLFWNMTKAAIQSFQIKTKLDWTNGIPGPETATALIQELKMRFPLKNKMEVITEPKNTPLENAQEYLAQEKFTKNPDWSYTNPSWDYTIIIQWNTVERSRKWTRVFGSWDDNTGDKLILSRIQALLSWKDISKI
jgi:hypothetical protein